MPPLLASVLCTGFVLYLLRTERQRSDEPSAASWIVTTYIISCLSKSLATWLSFNSGVSTDVDVEAGSPLDRALNLALMLSALVIVKRRHLDWRGIARGNGWLLAIYLYALVSIAWSDYTFISVKRYIRFLETPLMAGVILTERSPRESLKSIIRRTAFILIPFSLMLIKYYPQMGVAYGHWSGELMWVGVAYQKNSLGILCFVSAFFLFWSILAERAERPGSRVTVVYADGLVSAMAVYLLKGPGSMYNASATSISVLALGVMLLILLCWTKRHNISIGLPILIPLTVALFIYGACTPFGARIISNSLLELIGRNATFTDRDEIWAQLIPIAMRSPIFGLGFGGFWVVPIDGVNTPHNGYLGVMLELGLFGVFLVLGFTISMLTAAYASLKRDFWLASFGLCLLVMVVLHNTSEASFARTSDALWSLLVFLRIVLTLKPRLWAVEWTQEREGGAGVVNVVATPTGLT